jgi:hypothetical protein
VNDVRLRDEARVHFGHASAERYDRATGRWSRAGTMAVRHYGQTAVALS